MLLLRNMGLLQYLYCPASNLNFHNIPYFPCVVMQYYCHISLLQALWYSQANVGGVVWLALFIIHIILFMVYFINGHHKLLFSIILGYGSTPLVDWCLMFQDSIVVSFSGVKLKMAPYPRWREASTVLLHLTKRSYIHRCVITRGGRPFTMYIKVVLHFSSIIRIKWKCQILIWIYVMSNFRYRCFCITVSLNIWNKSDRDHMK